MEQWKDVDEYYEVSNLGRIRNKATRHIVKPYVKKTGYAQLALSDHGKNTTVLVHRLVAQAFVENPYGHPVVNHKDEDKLNNSADNLEWCTHQYNNSYGSQRMKHSHRVAQLDSSGKVLNEYDSLEEAAQAVGTTYQGISRVCRGLRKRCGGYGWKYIEWGSQRPDLIRTALAQYKQSNQ